MSTAHTPTPYAVGMRVQRGWTGEIGTVTGATAQRVTVAFDNGATDSQPVSHRAYRILPAADSLYRDERPAAQPDDAHWTDTVVSQGHADYCAAWGHAQGAPRCGRCGDLIPAPSVGETGATVRLLAGYAIPGASIPAGAVGTVQGVTGALVAVRFKGDIRHDWGIAPYDLEIVSRPGNAYSFYLGATPIYRPHTEEGARMPRPLQGVVIDRTYGVWDGITEAVSVYQTTLPDDATALRVAYAAAVVTGNDCVLVTRDARPADGPEFRAGNVGTREGNRTLIDSPYPTARDALGHRYYPAPDGDEIAYLAWADGSVTPVQ